MGGALLAVAVDGSPGSASVAKMTGRKFGIAGFRYGGPSPLPFWVPLRVSFLLTKIRSDTVMT